MTKVILLERLGDFTRETTGDLIMPVKRQEKDTEDPKPRAAVVHLMRLPDSKAATKKAPYILHQIVTGKDAQSSGEKAPDATAVVRSVFCVYCKNEQEGGLLLLNLMERFRIGLLEKVVIGKQFELDLEAGLETLIYPEDTAPYYAGEMISTWKLPKVERKIHYGKKQFSNIFGPG